ncbi:MAG: hypothetical protein GY827_04740 [Cytophagales bacterium]|nr:hypothetical protein [Cytophagales bacterium]
MNKTIHPLNLPELTPEKIESIERCYFGPTFNLTEKFLIDALEEHIVMYQQLMNREIPPRKVVGGGYKNGRKVAETWLREQIAVNRHLFKYFHTRNQLTDTQKQELL